MSCDCTSGQLVGLSRREVLRAAALSASALGLGLGTAPHAAGATSAAQAVAPGLVVHPRAAWSRGTLPASTLAVEAPGDVRFLLVHHTASSNTYGPDDVTGQLRAFHRFHTGPDRRWPDIAYNFLVDRFGGVWEGRAGSLAGPVMPDATGGSQGFAQLACFIGDHNREAPTAAAREAMFRVLAWLADRHGLDTSPGATARFVSRGSNRHPRGTEVTTATIAGHRDMSLTSCPGDAVYAQLGQDFPIAVTALRTVPARPRPLTPSTSTSTEPPRVPAPPSATPGSMAGVDAAAPTTPSPPSQAQVAPPGAAPDVGTTTASGPDAPRAGEDGLDRPLIAAGAMTTAVGAAGAAALSWRARRRGVTGHGEHSESPGPPYRHDAPDDEDVAPGA